MARRMLLGKAEVGGRRAENSPGSVVDFQSREEAPNHPAALHEPAVDRRHSTKSAFVAPIPNRGQSAANPHLIPPRNC
jgi:hypothetical protein